MKDKDAKAWLEKEGYPEVMTMTKDSLENILIRFAAQFKEHVKASELFKGSKSLTEYESSVLEETLRKQAKTHRYNEISQQPLPKQDLGDEDWDKIEENVELFYKVKGRFSQNADLIKRVIVKTIRETKAALQSKTI